MQQLFLTPLEDVRGAPTLRDYQFDLLFDAENAYDTAERWRVMMQAETGSGKTITASGAVHTLLSDPDLVVGWLTDRDELRDQSSEDLAKFDVPVVLARTMPPRRRVWQPGAVTAFSPTMRMPPPPSRARDEDGELVDPDEPLRSFLIVDEAHHSLAPSWRNQIEAGWDAVLGLTATPWHLRISADFRDVWDALVTGPVYDDLVGQGALCDYRIVYPSHGAVVQRRILRRDSSGEFTNESVTSEITRLLATDAVFDEWERAVEELADRRTLLFAPTVESAQQAAYLFADEGIKSAVLHAKTSKPERREIVRKFRSGGITVLSNVAVATEGFDCPAAAVVLMLRPTASLGLHRQMLGRTLRPSEGKDHAVIVDLVGNTIEHGGPDRLIDWSLSPRGSSRTGGNAAMACPYTECFGVNHVSSNICRACDGQLQFLCGRCYRRLLYSQFTHEVISSEPPQIVDDFLPVTEIEDGWSCRECSQVYVDDSVRVSRLTNGVLSPQKWKQLRKDVLSWNGRKHAHFRIRTGRKLPGWQGESSDGTLFEWDPQSFLVTAYPVFVEAPSIANGYRKHAVRCDPHTLGYASGMDDASMLSARALLGLRT